MNYQILIKIFILIVLIISAQLQLSYGQFHQRFSQPSVVTSDDNVQQTIFEDIDDSVQQSELLNPGTNQMVMPLPVINRSAPKNDVDWAEKFLRLPTWSSAYHKCDSENSEVSCYEIVRAAREVEKWSKKVKNQNTIGHVYVQITEEPFPDRLSMLYHGIQIAISTGRNLITDVSKFAPLSLPDTIKDSKTDKGGNVLPTNYLFGCSDVSDRFLDIKFYNASWPQVLYTHPVVAPYMRNNFGYHAAYFLGNYLYGQTEKPESDCFIPEGIDDIIEGWRFPGDPDMLQPRFYTTFLPRCGIQNMNSEMITNEPDEELKKIYKSVAKITTADPSSLVCSLRRMTSAKRIVQTFGSRLGFWATALQGSKGSFMNTIDRICVNMTNSQQGSLWHTYCPQEKEAYLYRTNSRFFICGPNAKDARLYIQYLLW